MASRARAPALAAQRSAAVPLAAGFALLVAYASLYPFTDWRWPAGRSLLDLMALPWPPWRDRFDEAANLAGYVPLGALLYGAVVRSGGRSQVGWLLGVVGASALSFGLEVTQNLLPYRVPSLKDWAYNAAGALVGVASAAWLHRQGLVDHWQHTRDRWFVRQSSRGLVLLLLWPIGLLFPAPLPLGVGQIGEELRELAAAALDGTSWASAAAPWLEPSMPLAPLSPPREGLAVLLGLVAPCLVAFSVSRPGWRRLALTAGATALALAATTLSTALNFGPDHALTWLAPRTLQALLGGALVAAIASLASRRVAAGLGLVALTALVALVSQAPSDPYYAASLLAWEQGRFIRFHGLARWVGWLWPYLAIAWLLTRIAAHADEPDGWHRA